MKAVWKAARLQVTLFFNIEHLEGEVCLFIFISHTHKGVGREHPSLEGKKRKRKKKITREKEKERKKLPSQPKGSSGRRKARRSSLTRTCLSSRTSRTASHHPPGFGTASLSYSTLPSFDPSTSHLPPPVSLLGAIPSFTTSTPTANIDFLLNITRF